MSRSRRAGGARGRGAASPERTEGAAPGAGARSGEARPSRLGGLFRGAAVPSPLPPLRACLARGFVAVGAQPSLLVPALTLVPAGWFALVAAGLQGPPGRMVGLLAIPPVSTYFDSLNAVALFGFPAGLWAAVPMVLVRALVLALLTGLVLESLEAGRVSRAGLRRGLRAWPTTALAGLLGLGLMVLASAILPFLGPGFGFLGSILTLVAAVFLFGYAPAVAARGGAGVVENIRRSVRGAMLPGSRQFLFSMLYVFVSLPLMVAFAPEGSTITVNPAFGTWVYALVAAFVHLGFLGAFAFRWLAAEPLLPERPAPIVAAGGRERRPRHEP